MYQFIIRGSTNKRQGTNLIPKQQVNVSKCPQTAVMIMAANTAFISVPQLADITTG